MIDISLKKKKKEKKNHYIPLSDEKKYSIEPILSSVNVIKRNNINTTNNNEINNKQK